ncbi:MAG: hypothetical protein AAF467_26770 [Actinomycetota bacterium]
MTDHEIWVDPHGLRRLAAKLEAAAAELRSVQLAMDRGTSGLTELAASSAISGARSNIAGAIQVWAGDADLLRSTAAAATAADEITLADTARRWLALRWNSTVEQHAHLGARVVYEGFATTWDLADGPWAPWTWADRWAGVHGHPGTGDFGGTFTVRTLAPYPGASRHATPTERGRETLRHALAETSADTQFEQGPARIWNDEFELIRHTPTRYTVILGGTQDLRRPRFGLDPHTRTVRDTDVFAIASADDASVDANGYAVMVRKALSALDVPQGSELMIVGHSYGADTAIDLAADPHVNGEQYEITHVVAAAYHVEPHLEHVQPGTRTLVVNNTHDAVVELERLVDRASVDSQTRHHHRAVISTFDGGLSFELGHEQERYLAHLATTADPPVIAFFASVDAAGYSEPGLAAAVDVSVPAAEGDRAPRSGPEVVDSLKNAMGAFPQAGQQVRPPDCSMGHAEGGG